MTGVRCPALFPSSLSPETSVRFLRCCYYVIQGLPDEPVSTVDLVTGPVARGKQRLLWVASKVMQLKRMETSTRGPPLLVFCCCCLCCCSFYPSSTCHSRSNAGATRTWYVRIPYAPVLILILIVGTAVWARQRDSPPYVGSKSKSLAGYNKLLL